MRSASHAAAPSTTNSSITRSLGRAIVACLASRHAYCCRRHARIRAHPTSARRLTSATNRRGCPLTSQAIGELLRKQLYAGIVDVPEYGVRARHGDFEPLISEELFYRVQGVLSGRVPSTTPQQRAHPDFPLRAFVRCDSCG